MKLDIIFENDYLIVINKPAGLVVNNSQTTYGETIQDQVSAYLKLAPGDLGIGERVGIVHRLDRETSGLLLVAKINKAFIFLQKQFKEHVVKKEYTALVHGEMKEGVVVSEKIGRVGRFGKFGITKDGRESETEIIINSKFKIQNTKFNRLLEPIGLSKGRKRYLDKQARNYTLVEACPKTGRTHQIRVHLKHLGYPVVSDSIYAPNKLLKFDLAWCPRLFLHAHVLSFMDPKTKKVLSFKSDLPPDLKNALAQLTPA